MQRVTYEIREVPAGDAAAYRLGSVAFGYADEPAPPAPAPDARQPKGRVSWGVFAGDGSLVAKAVDLEHHNWYGGRLVPASGIAGVAVAVEERGQGHARRVLSHLLAAARDRGAMISTLYGTTPVPYRRLGWEEIDALYAWSVPTLALAGLRVPAGYGIAAATESDVPAIFELFRSVARAGNGVRDRVPDPDFLADHHGTTIALDADGAIAGFCTWDRAGGYGADGTVTVDDLVALTEPALTALLATIGTWAAVAPHLIVRLPPRDPAFSLIPMSIGAPHSRRPWMLRVIDAPSAIAARGWPSLVSGSVDLQIDDPTCPWNSGAFRLTVEGGNGRLSPGGAGTVTVGPRGLATLYAGAASPDVLRRAGLLAGGDASTDEFLRAATAGPAPTLRDYF